MDQFSEKHSLSSVEEIRALREAHAQFQVSLAAAQEDFNQLKALDKQIKSFGVGPNPYTWFTMEALEETWKNLQKIIEVFLCQYERAFFCFALLPPLSHWRWRFSVSSEQFVLVIRLIP